MLTSFLHESKERSPITRRPETSRRRRKIHQRKGLSAVWLVVAIPVFIVLIAFMVNIANLWLARVELENALEASALAAVKEWGDAGGGATAVPRNVGVDYAWANTMRSENVEIATNLHPSPAADNPNENLTYIVGKADPDASIPPTGNLIFGAIVTDDPLYPNTFDAGVAGGCTPAGVFINVEKEDGGTNVEPRMFGVFFDTGPPNLSIRSVSITMPVLNPEAYFDSGQNPVVSIEDVGADELNRSNTVVPQDVKGLDWDPTTVASPLQDSLWDCPNPNGDICFTFEDPLGGSRYRTLTIHFTDGTFTTTNDPATTDFVRFGASMNGLKPVPPKGDNNDGDAFGRLFVPVTVVFYNSTTDETVTSTTVFRDVDEDGDGEFDDGRSEAHISGTGGGSPAVRAQAKVQVPIIFGKLLGFDFGSYCVHAKATAKYECGTGRVELIRVDRFLYPGMP